MKTPFSRDTGRLVCECGHEKMVHSTGIVLFDSHDFACAMMTCDCPEFLEAPREVVRRPKPLPALDRAEPKLSEL